MEAIEAQPGQFVSSKCGCHYQEPYGFVLEADCPQHNDKEFLEFVRYAEGRARKIEHEKCGPGCPLYSSGHSLSVDGYCNMGCC